MLSDDPNNVRAFQALAEIVRRRAENRAADGDPLTAPTDESQVRRDPQLRAERFVESWTRLKAQHADLGGWQNAAARRKLFS